MRYKSLPLSGFESPCRPTCSLGHETALSVAVLWILLTPATFAESLVERLLAPYEAVTTLVCSVRKETQSNVGSMRTLSRVHFARPDKLHVENYSPLRRRILADGRVFYSYIEGDRMGFSRPVEQLDEEMLFQLRKVPGTAMDHLFRLQKLHETPLEPTEEFPTRTQYTSDQKWIVLSVDATGRLAKIEFYEDKDTTRKIAQYRFEDFKEVLPGVWIPQRHEAWMESLGVTTHETSHIDNITVNGAIAEGVFEPGRFFKDVKFVDSFDLIYK